MIIFGWNKITTKTIRGVAAKDCSYCNTSSIWQLAVIRTWFTLFFIPIIPYKKRYCVLCPSCSSYIELDKEKFEEIEQELIANKNCSEC